MTSTQRPTIITQRWLSGNLKYVLVFSFKLSTLAIISQISNHTPCSDVDGHGSNTVPSATLRVPHMMFFWLMFYEVTEWFASIHYGDPQEAG